MKILALDSSGLVASVAVVENDTLLAEYTVNYKKTHSQTLLPMLDEISNMTELDLSTIDAIAVAGGAGSFTGLRIGSATAKGLGLALEKPLISIPTTAAIAYNIWDTNKFVCPIMDARRNQVYTGVYCYTDHRLDTVWEQDTMSIEALAEVYYKEGKIQTAEEHEPEYLRKSQAERERAERESIKHADVLKKQKNGEKSE